MKSIPLLNSDKSALVDDCDYERISAVGWRFHALGYATKGGPRQGQRLYMHRVVIGAVKGECVDHIDFNKLNNTRENLRICSPSENVRHKHAQRGKKFTKFKGIYWRPKRKSWEASIFFNGTSHYLGHFSEEKEAAEAYNRAAILHYKDFAHLNKL